jgi:Phosphotransferase enzyme family
MVRREPEETDVWRILLFGQSGIELLVLRSPSGLRLPELRIPRGQRVAPHLNAEAKRLWKLDTVCLFPLNITHGDITTADRRYHLMELGRPEELARVAPDFVPMSTLKEDSFADARDYLAVRRGMRLESGGLQENSRGPFSEFGAFRMISSWAEEQLRPLDLQLDGNFRQLQSSASFALIRFATNRGAVWFKAVGEPNLREFLMTKLLVARLPQYVPELLAAKTDWNAWLTVEAQGQGLFEASDPAIWCRTAESLAELQIASLAHAPKFLAAGAHDVRSQKLLDVAGAFFSAMEETMEAQTRTTVAKLGKQEIGTVREQVTEALHQLENAGIPDTLNHLDLNSSNVIVSTNRCAFLDWAQAAVGNPFFSLEYLRQQFLQAFPGRNQDESDFRSSYMNHWRPMLTGKIASDLPDLAPITAAFAFAASVLPWRDPDLIRRPQVAAFSRSLVRHMHRESQQIRASRTA